MFLLLMNLRPLRSTRTDTRVPYTTLFRSGDNPVVTSTFEGGYNDNKQYKNEMTFRLGIDPPMIKGLSINGFFSYDLYNRYQKIFRKPWTLYFPNWDSAERDANGFITSMEVVPTLRGYSAPELQENHDRYTRQLYHPSFSS